MKTGDKPQVTGDRPTSRSVRRGLSPVFCLLFLCFLFTACSYLPTSFQRRPPRPGLTTFSSPRATLPAQLLGNYLVVEAKWDRTGPYHFLVDTGSTVTLVSPALAKRYPASNTLPPDTPRMRVKSADGAVVELPPAVFRRFDFGNVRFDDVPVLVYDCAALSAHLGVQIDGVLGFPLFHDTLLTLDYPHGRVVLQPPTTTALLPGTTMPLDDSNKTPLFHLHLGNRTLVALIDSGSDAPLSLNPVGLAPQFAVEPRPGATVSTLTGDRPQRIGRLAETVTFAGYTLPHPIVELTDELSAIGGGILKHFTVTFDSRHDLVTFFRETHEPIVAPPRRSTGVSFTKTPAYWRVAGVIAGSPADQAHLEPGDLVSKINGEPVAKWDLRRYEQLVATASELTCTLLHGESEVPTTFATFELVP